MIKLLEEIKEELDKVSEESIDIKKRIEIRTKVTSLRDQITSQQNQCNGKDCAYKVDCIKIFKHCPFYGGLVHEKNPYLLELRANE